MLWVKWIVLGNLVLWPQKISWQKSRFESPICFKSSNNSFNFSEGMMRMEMASWHTTNLFLPSLDNWETNWDSSISNKISGCLGHPRSSDGPITDPSDDHPINRWTQIRLRWIRTRPMGRPSLGPRRKWNDNESISWHRLAYK